MTAPSKRPIRSTRRRRWTVQLDLIGAVEVECATPVGAKRKAMAILRELERSTVEAERTGDPIRVPGTSIKVIGYVYPIPADDVWEEDETP